MVTVAEMFPSKYVAAADLRGLPLVVTIDRVVEEVVDATNGETAYICYFAGFQRGLRLNRINARTIGETHGTESLGWSGKSVELYPTTVSMNGKQVDCIRVRAVAQAAAAPVPVEVQEAPAPQAAPAGVTF